MRKQHKQKRPLWVSFVLGGGHGGRPHPFSIRLRLCFTGVPRMGPSMPLPALRLSIGRIGLQDSSPAAGSFVIRPSKNEIDAHLGVFSFLAEDGGRAFQESLV